MSAAPSPSPPSGSVFDRLVANTVLPPTVPADAAPAPSTATLPSDQKDDDDDRDKDSPIDVDVEIDRIGDQQEHANDKGKMRTDAAAAVGSEDPVRLARTVFVGNVPLTAVTSKSVKRQFERLFSAHGQVESVRFRSIAFTSALPRRMNLKLGNFHPQRDSANAYVVMRSTEQALAAVKQLNGHLFESHHLRLDMCRSQNAKGQSTSTSAANMRCKKRTVFVGNLGLECSDDSLWTYFEKAGSLDYVRVVRDRKTGLGKGFAYVQFKERQSVPLAMELHDTEFEGNKLRVFHCRADPHAAVAHDDDDDDDDVNNNNHDNNTDGASKADTKKRPEPLGALRRIREKKTIEGNGSDNNNNDKRRPSVPSGSKRVPRQRQHSTSSSSSATRLAWKRGMAAKKSKVARDKRRKAHKVRKGTK